mgnify:FL=1
MKSVIKYSILLICFSVSILLLMDINSISQRKSEMEDAVEISMRNSLKAVGIHKMYAVDESGMEAELLREFASNINSDTDYTLRIMDISRDGLLDVELIADFVHMNGVRDQRRLRKTMIIEAYDLP